MIKIGDFSRMGFVTVQTLRHYDEIGLLKPVKVDQFTGYRYYSADQLPRLNYIIALKNLGLSLDDIAVLINDSLSAEHIREIFTLKRAELQKRVLEEQKRLAQVEEVLKQIEKEGSMPKYHATIKKLEPEIVVSIRDVLPEFSGVGIGEMFQELIGFLVSNGIKPTGPSMLIYRDTEYREQDADVEVAAPIGKVIPGAGRIKVYELPAVEQAATVTYNGTYEDMGEAYNEIMSWIASSGYQISGFCRELYLVSPGDTDDPSQYVTEIQVSITSAQKDT